MSLPPALNNIFIIIVFRYESIISSFVWNLESLFVEKKIFYEFSSYCYDDLINFFKHSFVTGLNVFMIIVNYTKRKHFSFHCLN